MRCAVYVRRSTEEHQAASLAVQLEEATRYIEARGWTLAPDHVYQDDAKSRAEFKKRPALLAMVAAAQAHAFDALVVRDETRVGGDMMRTTMVLTDIVDAGVRVFYYATDDEVRLDGPTEKMIQVIRNYAAEIERGKISGRTREHLLTKARRGLNVGGRVYGYDNVATLSGEQRVHVDFAINPTEAGIVTEVFARYAAGDGLRTIVKDLNARKIPKPRTGRRGTGSWAMSALWSMLRNDRYRGVLTWGRTEKTYRSGTKVRVKRDRCDWTIAERPDLRIVPEELWFAVQARIADTSRPGAPKRKRGRPGKYLLSGLARCGECGGPLTVINHKHGQQMIKVYTCAYHRERGDSVCASAIRRPIDAINQAVVDWIEDRMLKEDAVRATMRLVRLSLAEHMKAVASNVPELEKQARTLRTEIDRLVAALATSNEKPAPVVKAINDRQEQLSSLEARLRAAAAAPEAISLELRRMETEARRRIAELRDALRENPEQARWVMSAVLDGPLTCTATQTPEGRRFRIEGNATIGKLLTFEVSKSASPTGFEPVLQP